MANATRITSLSSPKSSCLVAAARERMLLAGEDNDVGFMEAQEAIYILPAKSVAGVAAKFEQLAIHLDALREVDDGALASWDSIEALQAGIQAALLHLQSEH